MQPEQPIDYNQPVAYDNQGRPLYARPPMQPAQLMAPLPYTPPLPPPPAMSAQAPYRTPPTPMPMYMQPAPTGKRGISEEEVRRLHENSMKRFPGVNLSEEQYIISEVKRQFGGLIGTIGLAVLFILFTIIMLFLYPKLVPSNNPPLSSLLLPAGLFIALILLGTYIVIWTYGENRFFVTNESIIQEVQSSFFGHSEKTISLSEIDSISFTQKGLVPMIMDVGVIRLTTEGDNETFFGPVAKPKKIIMMLNSVLEDFKNDRPISEESIVDTLA